ncbi:MAG: RNA-binding S4 domain-containing protein [Puniceicoccaceae bacterium]|nr:MAG: RNA-binding S4 domain-containing protein [Puniceicoccaceae bacterium]
MSEPTMRIDKWLWAVRLFKTRGLALEACKAGHVRIEGQPVKPSRMVRGGEEILARVHLVERKVRVLGLPASRVGPQRVAEFMDDLTPPEAYDVVRENRIQAVLQRPRGEGRPTKRERRLMDRLLLPPD